MRWTSISNELQMNSASCYRSVNRGCWRYRLALSWLWGEYCRHGTPKRCVLETLTWLCIGRDRWNGRSFGNRIWAWNWRSRPPIRINDTSAWNYNIASLNFSNISNSNGPKFFFMDHNTTETFQKLKMLVQREETRYLTSFGVVFWKVDFIESLSITVPSSETLLMTCQSRWLILGIEWMIIKFDFMM